MKYDDMKIHENMYKSIISMQIYKKSMKYNESPQMTRRQIHYCFPAIICNSKRTSKVDQIPLHSHFTKLPSNNQELQATWKFGIGIPSFAPPHPNPVWKFNVAKRSPRTTWNAIVSFFPESWQLALMCHELWTINNKSIERKLRCTSPIHANIDSSIAGWVGGRGGSL